MLNRLRKYLTTGTVLVGISLLGATAFAVAGDKGKGHQKDNTEVSDSLEAPEVEAAEVEDQGEGGGPNHGHCVSYWAHASKEAGLKGKARGQFISSIAKEVEAVSEKLEEDATPEAEGDCDFQTELGEAVAAQDAAETPESDAEVEDEDVEESGASNASHGKGKGKGNRD